MKKVWEIEDDVKNIKSDDVRRCVNGIFIEFFQSMHSVWHNFYLNLIFSLFPYVICNWFKLALLEPKIRFFLYRHRKARRIALVVICAEVWPSWNYLSLTFWWSDRNIKRSLDALWLIFPFSATREDQGSQVNREMFEHVILRDPRSQPDT